jgi:predicted N-acetyltransferase YhbS
MKIHPFLPADADTVNAVAVAAFAQYEGVYDDWDALMRGVGSMASFAGSAEIIVAEDDGDVVGAVAYIPPLGSPRADFFKLEWPIIRMLVVDPRARGQGIGRSLTEPASSAPVGMVRRQSASTPARQWKLRWHCTSRWALT